MCANGYKTSLNQGVRSPPEVQYTTPMVREYDEDKKNPEGRRWHGEKVDGRSLGQMIGQKRSQGLAGRFPRTRRISSHCLLRHRNPQLAELPMNADLERPFRPVVIRAHGQVETEVPLSVPRWPRAVR
jgi:hypothetical protein